MLFVHLLDLFYYTVWDTAQALIGYLTSQCPSMPKCI